MRGLPFDEVLIDTPEPLRSEQDDAVTEGLLADVFEYFPRLDELKEDEEVKQRYLALG